MEAVRNEQNYGDISSEDVMRCIPRGLILHPTKTGWLSCRHCNKNGKFLQFPNDIGVKHHFARGGCSSPPSSLPQCGQGTLCTWHAPPSTRYNAFQPTEEKQSSGPTMSEDSASDTSDGPPPWEQPVEVDNMAVVKYQGPVTIHAMVDPVPGPSFEDQANALPKRDKIIQVCQSDEMFTWVHALATILVINEKAVLGGLKVSEQLKVWQDRIRILKKPPWIFAPLNLSKTIENTTWAEAMTARPVMGTDGLLTIAIGDGSSYKVLPKTTTYFGVIAALFKKLWDQAEMHETLETDDNFEIVASTVKAIYDQTCRTCGLINRLIIYMPKEGTKVRKMRIDHEVGDTPAKLRLLRPKLVDKRHSEDSGPVSDKRQKEDNAKSRQKWDDNSWWHSSDWHSSSSSWRWNR
ncbi:unnamed protein product [Symbiodinium sp. KB8]|nr:unnamed protein product [Symbiodinium sp. KB8]